MVATRRARVADTRKVLIRRRLPRGLEGRTPRECVLASPELLRTERRISVECAYVVAESRNEVTGTSLNRMRHRTVSANYARSWTSSPVRTLPTGKPGPTPASSRRAAVRSRSFQTIRSRHVSGMPVRP